MTDQTVPRRHPDDVALIGLYEALWEIAARKSAGKGLQYGTAVSFSEGDIANALRAQGIHDPDLGAGISCAVDRGFLEKWIDGYHFTADSLAVYSAVK